MRTLFGKCPAELLDNRHLFNPTVFEDIGTVAEPFEDLAPGTEGDVSDVAGEVNRMAAPDESAKAIVPAITQ